MSRFNRKKTTKFIACPLVADPLTGPSRAEMAAGTPLTDIAAVTGFSLTGSTMPTPDLDSRFVSSVPGDDTVSDPSITFWDDDEATVIRDVLAKDTQLFIVYLPYGDVPGKRCEVWDVACLGVNDQIDLSTAAQFMVGFSVNEEPVQNAVVPPAAV
ncbi:phage tail tube protein [Modestobacter sp. VKM Ac-2985]|uniref:phage tail tube protein n=1 Tax=Modestobacter sp. VKM Ac-2985 TaxID=3004139 RepID=UPI0022ABB9C8|nr:hypothetical protein [Modestobacter sp. VKM Ac-2985]MCZ2837137.1 hypothetical protein [Modestobacter sp. VKM Ac-2985]